MSVLPEVRIEHVPVPPLSPRRFATILEPGQVADLEETIDRGHRAFAGRVIWNVNSTAQGGGVAEMLRSLIAYVRGAELDARWVVIGGNPDFFTVTKRIHNQLHGSPGDGGGLGEREREVYAATCESNARALEEIIRPGDVALLHDPQTAGLVTPLRERGAHVVWRCHVGLDMPNQLARDAWAFLSPFVADAQAYVFSRQAFVWEGLDPERLAVIPPSIDAFSPKNQQLDEEAVAGILHASRVVVDGSEGAGMFERIDGTPGRVDRHAEMFETEPLRAGTPVVAQVSRWDRLKDPLGVMDGFVEHVAPRAAAHLVLAGPEVAAVADDPEGREVLEEARARWEALPDDARGRIHLACLPMTEAEENAAIVNAIQRHATVVVQKSLAEGFGLTVSEAMWKGRPVVASRVGGIQDQIEDGETGRLVEPLDLPAFGEAVVGLLDDAETAARIGSRARDRVRTAFLGPRHLRQYVELFERVLEDEAA